MKLLFNLTQITFGVGVGVVLALLSPPKNLHSQATEPAPATKTRTLNFQILSNKNIPDIKQLTFEIEPGQHLFGVRKDGTAYQILAEGKTNLELAPGKYVATFSYNQSPIGQKTFDVAPGPKTPEQTLVFDLNKLDQQSTSGSSKFVPPSDLKRLQDVTVRSPIEREKDSSKNEVRREELEFSPGSGGDPLKALKNLPGIVGTGSAFFEGLYVRGGNQEDVLYTIDDIVIGDPYHAIGIYSVFASEALSAVEFFPSAYPYNFGNSQGAAINIVSRQESITEFEAELDLNLGVSAFYFALPIIPGKLTFFSSFRRSNYELYLAIARTIPEIEEFLDFPAPVFLNNYNKLDFALSPEHQFTLIVVGKYDVFEVASPFPFEDADGEEQDVVIENAFKGYWNSFGITHTWTTPLLVNKFILSQLFDRNTALLFGSEFSTTDRIFWSAQNKTTFLLSDSLQLSAGLTATFEQLTGRNRVFSIADITSFDERELNAKSDYDAIQLDIEFFKSGRLKDLNDYDRVLLSGYLGAQMNVGRFTFSPGGFATYNTAAERAFLDPRLETLYTLNDTTTLFARSGFYTQLPDFLVLVPQEFPKENDPKIDNPTTLHTVVGFETDLNNFNFKAEGYYQYGTKQILFNPGFDPTKDASLNDNPYTINKGRNRGYGAELLLKHKVSAAYYSLFTYTYATAERYDFPEGTDKIEWFPYNQDVRHQFSALASFNPNNKWRLGTRLSFITGKPRTETLLVFTDSNSNNSIDDGELAYRTDTENQNQNRNPFNVRLDFRVDYSFNLFGGKASFYLDVWNLEFFVRPNVLGYAPSRTYLNETASSDFSAGDFNNDNNLVVPIDKLQSQFALPPFLPLLGFTFAF